MIHLCEPFVTDEMREAVQATMKTRFIGQGPKVDEFEEAFRSTLGTKQAVAVGSGTDAIHLAFLLAGIKPGDEVLAPVFNCTAGTHVLKSMGAKVVFVDVDPRTLCIDTKDLENKITTKTKAVMTMDYAGQPCNYNEINRIVGLSIPIIQDAAHSVGSTYEGLATGLYSDYTIFSFQAIKHITTGDGGMITVDPWRVDQARRLRWFGIDRKKKMANMSHWKDDITEVGYKYQMTDIAASMGLESLKVLNEQIEAREVMVSIYRDALKWVKEVQTLATLENARSSHWLFTILVEDRDGLRDFLLKNDIESSPLHYRNDQYSVFSEFKSDCPNMDIVENKILCLPLHMNLAEDDIIEVANKVKEYYDN